MNMSIYTQHGYGKGDKINKGLQNDLVSGVILSPKDESPDTLSSYITDLRQNYSSSKILLDPQFYVATISPVIDGHLPEYEGYYHPNLTRTDFSPANIQRYVEECINYQISLNLDRIISPTVSFDDFKDTWSQISIFLAQQSLQYYNTLNDKPPLLIALVFSENALKGEDMNEFLNIITTFNAKGFYIIVNRNLRQYQQQIEPEILENFLHFTYILSVINNFEVILGYTDLVGIPLHVSGAMATACGWFSNLRQFSLSRFQPTSGGRTPRPRYTSIPLLNSILVVPEMDSIRRAGMLREIITSTSYDAGMKTNPVDNPWPPEISCLHHWESLRNVINHIESLPDIRSKLAWIKSRIERANLLYNSLSQRGVAFETGFSHLQQWMQAITGFRNRLGI